MTETVKINLWNPHKNQKQITQDKARFKVIVCGRRFGKTTLSIYTLLKHALSKKNGKYFYIAPTYKQAKMIAWSMLLEAVNKLPNELVKKVNESELYVVVGNNSRIDIKGADNPDSLRGVGLHGVVLDEYADMKPNVFNEIIEPALADHKGWAMFIGTPKGFNHFFDLFNQADGQENWSHYRFTSYDNPFLEREELERIKLKTPEDVFMQEYMADFRKHEGLVYKEFDRDFHLYDDEQIRPGIVDRIVAIDFGFTNPTAVLLIEKDSDSSYWVHDG
jgi:phage terminase large subunit